MVFSTRAATYKVIIQSLKHLPYTKLDAAFGLTGLVFLYIIRWICERLTKRYPRAGNIATLGWRLYADLILARFWFFFNVFRNAFVIIVLTFASWLYCRHHKSASGKYPIKILQNVPRGFKHIGQPVIDPQLVSALAGGK